MEEGPDPGGGGKRGAGLGYTQGAKRELFDMSPTTLHVRRRADLVPGSVVPDLIAKGAGAAAPRGAVYMILLAREAGGKV